MAEIIYPYELCRYFKCQTPLFVNAYNVALDWEGAAVDNAKASTDQIESKLYYDEANRLHKKSASNLRTLEDFAGLPKPEICQYCTFLPAELRR